MNILLIGSGGREHALAFAMARSPLCTRLMIAPGNAGTAEYGTNVVLDVADHAAVIALCRTMDQANTIGMLGGMVMAGLGGALAPVSSFPGWVQSVAPFTPAYWVLDALRRLTLEHATLADVAPATGIALAFAAGFALIAALCFRSSAVKIGTT